MQDFSFLVLWCVLGIQATFAETGLGPVHFLGVVGQFPEKYLPLTKADEIASSNAAAAFANILKIVPNELKVPQFGPIDINIPDLSLHGKLDLNNIILRGVQQLVMQKLEVRTTNKRIDYVVHGSGVSGESAIGAKKVSLPPVGNVYQVESGELNVDIQNININIKNKDVATDVDSIKGQVEQLKDHIGDVIVATALKEANKVLAKLPASIIDIYLRKI